jgi:hypothetical protein
MMKPHYLIIILCAGYISWAQAEIYKTVDADGHVTYSSVPTKGSKKVDLGPLTIVPSPAVRVYNDATPSVSLKVDLATQKNRDNLRRKILEEELSTEKKLVEEARQTLINGKEHPEILKDKDGKSYRNAAKYEENIKALQWQVTLHEQNVEALKAELIKLK